MDKELPSFVPPAPVAPPDAPAKPVKPDIAGPMGVVIEKVLGAPESGSGLTQFKRASLSDGNVGLHARIKLKIQQNADRIVKEMRKYLDARKSVIVETGKELHALDAFFRSMGVLGQSIKMISSPYAPEADQDTAASNVLDTEEGILLERFNDYLSKVNVKELVDMMIDNDKFVSMLVDTESQEQHRGGRVQKNTMQDDGEKIIVDPSTPEGRGHLRDLRALILGEKVNGKERSAARRNFEMALWVRIVGAMHFDQKQELIQQFLLKDETGAQTKDFIKAAIIAGVLTKAEVLSMSTLSTHETLASPNPTDSAKHIVINSRLDGHLFRTKLDDAFLNSLDDAVQAHKEIQDRMKEAAAEIENPRIENAAAHFLSFENLIAGRVMDWGVLTFAINTVVGGMEAMGQSQGGWSDKTLAFLKGSLGGATSGYALAGVAAAVWGTNKIVPWVEKFANRPSGDEKIALAHNSSISWLREEIAQHERPGNAHIGAYMQEHYEDYMRIAVLNKNNANPLQKEGEKRGAFDLYPGDIKITDKEAGELGYANAKEAVKTLHRFFNICAKSTESGGQEIATKEDLQKFLDTQVYLDYDSTTTT